MRISNPEVDLVANEVDLLDEILPLAGTKVLELGCGTAEKTRIVSQKAASILALEVDEIQLKKNKMISDLPNVTFSHGGAEKILAADASFDIVLMFKSLHHVPVDLMEKALNEVSRVLKQGGLAYVSEPVYAGDFNNILSLFHDERVVREAAFAAVKRIVSSRRMALVTQKFFLQPMHFEDFTEFEEQVIGVTHSDHKLSTELFEEVRAKFNKCMTPAGADFYMPIRVDLLSNNLF